MNKHRAAFIGLVFTGFCVLILTADPGWGQPGRSGGFNRQRGPGGGGGGLVDTLTRESVQTELKITDEQKAKIQELSESLSSDRRAMFSRFQGITSEEERTALREQITKEQEEKRKVSEGKLKEILSPEQFTRGEQIYLHGAGAAALSREEIAAALKLTDAQKEDIKKIQEEYQNQIRSGGWNRPREEQDKQKAENEAKLLAVLTPDQKKSWEVKLGPPPADAAKTAGTTSAATAPAVSGAAVSTKPSYEPVKPEGAPVVAELSPEAVAKAKRPTELPNQGEPGAANQAKEMSFNFRFAPWEMVLKIFAEQADLTLDMNVVPPGTFNYYDKGKYSPAEAMDVLNGYLLQKGYILIRRDRFLVVVNLDNGIPPNLIPEITVEELPSRGKNEILSLLLPLPLNDLNAAAAAAEVQPLLGPQGKVAPLSAKGQLVITDIGSNLQRIVRLLNGPTAVPTGKGNNIRTFPLKHISATDAESTIRDLFGLPPRSSTVARAGSSSSSRYGGSRDSSGYGSSSGYSGYGSNGSGSFSGGSPWDRFRSDSGFRPPDGGFRPPDGGSFRSADGRSADGRSADGRSADGRSSSSAAAATSDRIQLSVNLRTNSLLVKANPDDLAVVEKAIEAIDVDESASGRPVARGNNVPQFEVYALKNADSRVVAETLAMLLPGAQVGEDSRSRRISVYAPPAEHQQVKAIIAELDGPASESVAVIQLKKNDAVATAASLKAMFKTERSSDAPSIEANALARQLMVKGTPEQLTQIKAILAGLGEDGNAASMTDLSAGGNVRTIPLGGRDSDEVIGLLRQMWPDDGRNPIRIVVPSALTPSRRVPVPLAPREADTETAPPPAKTGGTPRDNVRGATLPVRKTSASSGPRVTVETVFKQVDRAADVPATSDDDDLQEALQPEVEVEAPPAKPATPPASSKSAASQKTAPQQQAVPEEAAGPQSPVHVSPIGGNLIVTSDDLEALNRIERLLQVLNQTPVQPKWTVFYLRSADATETANMLGHLFPQGSVSQTADSGSGLFGGMSSSLSSLGSGLMDATGLSSLGKTSQALRIVPEIRSNALFVTGPSAQVRQVEEILKVLDTGELPESLKDRVPRMIAVEHANVDDVAQVVQDVYKEQIEGQQQQQGGGRGGSSGGGGGGFNPLAMIMGGQNGGRQSRSVQLTVGVDTRTNTLVVSCSDALFRQVEALVKSLDKAALEANRTVRVVSLQNANSAIVQQSLSSLVGKVKVSSTGGDSSRSRSSSSGSSSQTSSSGPNPDDFRRMMEMRQRFEGGASGFSPFGGFRSSDGGSRFGGSSSGSSGRPSFFGGNSGGDRGRSDSDRGRGDR